MTQLYKYRKGNARFEIVAESKEQALEVLASIIGAEEDDE